jgi:Glycosyl transferases group 1
MTAAVATEEPTQASTGALLSRLMDEVPQAVEPDDFEEQAQGKTGLNAVEPQSLSVAYVLPGLPPEGSGGSHSLVQEARGLRKLGAGARVCVPGESLRTAVAVYGNDDGLFAPYEDESAGLGGEATAIQAIGDAEVVVATEYPSVDLLVELSRERPSLVCAYYVQDYEPLFAAQGSPRADRALLSYRAIPDMLLFAKTEWLRGVVSALHGVRVAKVAPSLDRELFHARGRLESSGALRVAAMIRPRTPRRRPAATLRTLELIADALGDRAQLLTFGCDEESFTQLHQQTGSPIGHLGLLSRAEVSELMRRCDVFIDASAYQAFGRTGLEAMACGAVPVLPALGGVHEYAVDGENAAIVGDCSDAKLAQTVIDLGRDDDPTLRRLRDAGLRVAQRFSIERAARSQLELFSTRARG